MRGRNGAEVNTFAYFLLANGFASRGAGGRDGRIAAMPTNPRQARKDLLVKGLILSFLGLIVLVSPLFIHSSGFAQAVGGSSVVGWFALVLGIAFLAQWALRRNKP